MSQEEIKKNTPRPVAADRGGIEKGQCSRACESNRCNDYSDCDD